MKTIVVLLLLVVGCAETLDAKIEVVAFRDPSCGPDASEDCVVLVPPGTQTVLPTEAFELIVHADGPLDDLAIRSNGAVVEPLSITVDDNASGTDVTLLVPPLPPGTVACNDYELIAIDPDRSLRYGSGYASNCSCSFCIKYCTVNGATYKNGTCC